MRIAYVAPGILPLPPVLGGSVETYVEQLTKVLPEHEITIYSGTCKTRAKEEQLGNIRYLRYAGQNWRSYLQHVCRHVEQNNYQVIQIENRPGFVPAIVQAAKASKVILNLHSLNFVTNLKYIAYPIGFCLEQADLITVNSHYVAQQLHELFPGLSTPVAVIHLGTDPRRFISRWEQSGKNRRLLIRRRLGVSRKKVVLFAGRIIPGKGVHVLVKAMQQVVRSNPNCVLMIAGGAGFGTKKQTAYMNKIWNLARQNKCKTIFLKAIKYQNMPDYYLAADVLVCPSIHSEAFGLVNVEAMSTGLVVVGSNIGGIPEVISPNQSGLLVPAASRSALSKALDGLLADTQLMQRMGRFGRKRVQEYFNWSRVGHDMNQYYATLRREQIGGRAIDLSQGAGQLSTSPQSYQDDVHTQKPLGTDGT